MKGKFVPNFHQTLSKIFVANLLQIFFFCKNFKNNHQKICLRNLNSIHL